MVRGMTPNKYRAKIRGLESEVRRWRNDSGEMTRQRDEAKKRVREVIDESDVLYRQGKDDRIARQKTERDLDELREDTKGRILKLNFERDALASTIHSMAQALSRRQMADPPLRSERTDARKMYGLTGTAGNTCEVTHERK